MLHGLPRALNRWLQIAEQHKAMALPGKDVLVIHKRDGSLLLEHNGIRLHAAPVSTRPQRKPKRSKRPIVNNKVWKPSASHPWKRVKSESSTPPA